MTTPTDYIESAMRSLEQIKELIDKGVEPEYISLEETLQRVDNRCYEAAMIYQVEAKRKGIK